MPIRAGSVSDGADGRRLRFRLGLQMQKTPQAHPGRRVGLWRLEIRPEGWRSEGLLAGQTRGDDRGDNRRVAVHDRASGRARHLLRITRLRGARDDLGRRGRNRSADRATAPAGAGAARAAAAAGRLTAAVLVELRLDALAQARLLAAIVAGVAGRGRSAARLRSRAADRLRSAAGRSRAAGRGWAAAVLRSLAAGRGRSRAAGRSSFAAAAAIALRELRLQLCEQALLGARVATRFGGATAATTASAPDGSGDHGSGHRSGRSGRGLARQPRRGQHEIRGIHDRSSWGRPCA
jgi:hypothetical protein